MKLALVLALALGACGSTPPAPEEPVTPSAEPPSADRMAPGGATCPALTLEVPGHSAKGSVVEVTLGVTGGDPTVAATYQWTVSAGAITQGQGTAAIAVSTEGADGNVTLSVEVGGYDPACKTTASTTTHVM